MTLSALINRLVLLAKLCEDKQYEILNYDTLELDKDLKFIEDFYDDYVDTVISKFDDIHDKMNSQDIDNLRILYGTYLRERSSTLHLVDMLVVYNLLSEEDEKILKTKYS